MTSIEGQAHDRFGMMPPLSEKRVGAYTILGALEAPDCLCVWAKEHGAFFWVDDREVVLTGTETQEEMASLVLAHGMDILRECLGGGEG